MIAKVKWFNNEKGYGFLLINGIEAFVHYSEIQEDGYKTLDTDESVDIGKLIETDKGFQAKSVKRLEK